MKYNPENDNIPYGQCHCGCGGYTTIAPQTSTEKGWVRGEPVRFISGHFRQARRIENPEEYFWSKIDIRGPDECWPWKGGVNGGGYGEVTFLGRDEPSHRAAWRLANGQEIPDGLIVRHTCDNRRCNNPAHLILGTYADNVTDREERGRSVYLRGEDSPRAKLSEAEVREIIERLANGESRDALATQFDVSYCCIADIDSGRSWSHIER